MSPADSTSAPPWWRGRRVGRWAIERPLGRGVTAAVFAVRHVETGRRGAAKLLDPSWYDDVVVRERFVREVDAMAQFDHPNVVQVLDAGDDQGPFVVMEHLDGETLEARLAREKTLSVEAAIDLVCALCAGVAAVHRRGVLHRDIKPANIVLVRRDDDIERPVLIDFGAARLDDRDALRPALTEAGQWVGTPAYLAPECVQGVDLDARSDVFALGVVLYECLSGQRPFDKGSSTATVWALSTGRFASIAKLVPTLSSSVARVIDQSLGARDQRPPDASALAEALRVARADTRGARARWAAPLAATVVLSSLVVGLLMRPATREPTPLRGVAPSRPLPPAVPTLVAHAQPPATVLPTPEPVAPAEAGLRASQMVSPTRVASRREGRVRPSRGHDAGVSTTVVTGTNGVPIIPLELDEPSP